MAQLTPSLPYFKSDLTNTKTLVRAGSLRLTTMEVQNINTSDIFVQMFNAAAVADVTLGTTAPTQSYCIPASDGVNRSLSVKDWGDRGLHFNKGLVIVATTTVGGSTAPAQNSVINLTFG